MSLMQTALELAGSHDRAQLKLLEQSKELLSENSENNTVGTYEQNLQAWKRILLSRDLSRVPLKLLLEHGVPDVLRGAMWKIMSRADDHEGETRSFRELVEQSQREGDSETHWAIEKDIRRTFPRHVLFETKQGQEQLSQVLRAYAIYDPHVGYCQGMGFIAALLLCYTCSEDAFWILRSIMCRPEFDLRSMLSPGMPKFTPTMRELTRFIEIIFPDIAAKLSYFSIDPSIFASQWFITLFSYNMSFDLVAQVWDLFFVKKWPIIFRVTLALLELVRADLESANDIETILKLLKDIPERVTQVDSIIDRAMRLNLDEEDARVLGNIARSESEEVVLDD